MGYDASGLLDLEGEGVPDLFLVTAISLLVFLIADLGFTGFRTGDLGLIVTSFLFTITIIAALALSERTILSDGHILDGVLGFTIGVLVLNIGSIFGNLNLSVLSTATETYLSGILAQGQSIVIPIVNIVFAPIGETLLILLGFTAAIWQIVKRTGLKDAPAWQLVIILGTIPSIIFGGLHGAVNLQFFLLAFGFNMFWTAILVYSDLGRISTRWIPGSIGLVAGLHVGFNSSNFGGILKFLQLMVDSLGGTYGRSALAILIFFGIMFLGALIRVYMLLMEKEVI